MVFFAMFCSARGGRPSKSELKMCDLLLRLGGRAGACDGRGRPRGPRRSRRQSIRLMKWAFFATSLARRSDGEEKRLQSHFPTLLLLSRGCAAPPVRPGDSCCLSCKVVVMMMMCVKNYVGNRKERHSARPSDRPPVRSANAKLQSLLSAGNFACFPSSLLPLPLSPSLGLLQTNALNVS